MEFTLCPVSISTHSLRRELMRIRINRPPSGTPPSRDTAAQWLAPSASKVDASPFRSPRGLDGAELCVATAKPSRLM